MIIKKKFHAYLSKMNFLLNRNPMIEKTNNWRNFIPTPYKTVITICADFELAWAWRFSKSLENPLDFALKKAEKARSNIPVILDLCDKYEIPITWATVGHLLLSDCKNITKKPHSDILRLNHFENDFWRYDQGDWFQHDPCSHYQHNPEWYAPDLIQEIISRKTKHEIGCHTFSHIDCSDTICPPPVFKSEIDACIDAANKLGITLRSFIHPGHTIGNLALLDELGFTSYRTDYRNVLGYPKHYNDKLWEFKQTVELVYQQEWDIDFQIKRYKKIIDRAINSNTVGYFWFHPSMDTIFIEKILPPIFAYINNQKEEILTITSGDYIDWINTR